MSDNIPDQNEILKKMFGIGEPAPAPDPQPAPDINPMATYAAGKQARAAQKDTGS